MAFLTKEELKTVATMPIIDKITNLDDSIVEDIINESIAMMKGYLSRFYDAELLFGKIGNERHLAVLKKLKDIVIYEIYERHTRDQNVVAQRRFAEAMNWLEKLNTGEHGDHTLPPAPPVDSEDGGTGTTGDARFGGNKKYSSHY
jgi:phage gp36-like protein